jgi:hypothetical protein
MINWPSPLGELFNPLCAWLNWVLGSARKCEPLDIEGFSIELTPSGWRARKKFQTVSAGQSAPSRSSIKEVTLITLGSSLTPSNPELLICQDSGGSTIYVAKDTESQRNAKEFYFDNGDNVTVTYTYFTATQSDAAYGDNFRMASDGINTELQVMEKRYLTKGMILAIDPTLPIKQAVLKVADTGSPTGIKDPTGKDVTYIEIKPTRVWVRYATQ